MLRKNGVRLLATLLVLLATGTARAQEDARSIGGRRVDIRVRERDRMQREYEAMRKARSEKLRDAREETAGSGGEGVRGWRSGGYGTRAPSAPEPAPAPPRRSGGIRPIEGTPKYLLYAAVVALSAIIVVRFRQRRAAVTS